MNKFIINGAAFAVIFFLTFLGMRITFLDPSPKPKPRPRAVLKNYVKSNVSVQLNQKLNDSSPGAVPEEQRKFRIAVQAVPLDFSSHSTFAIKTCSIFSSPGRSPPHNS